MNPRLALLCLGIGLLQAPTQANDLHELTKGVTKIATPGLPGRVAVFGPQALTVVLGKAGNTLQPAVAAARYGQGRIVAFGHDGYFDAGTLKQADTGKLLLNALNWANGGREKPIVVALGANALVPTLNSLSLTAAPADLAKLSPASVLVADARHIAANQVEAIHNFIHAGGGFVVAATGWGWQQLHPGKDLATDLPANRILVRAGLVFAGDSLKSIIPDGFAVDANAPPLSNASAALAAVLGSLQGAPLNPQDAELASASLLAAAENLPPTDQTFLPKLQALMSIPNIDTVPTPKKPVKTTQPASRVVIGLQAKAMWQAAPGRLTAHPAAQNFPGPVPVDAPRLRDVTVTIDTSVRDWHSTGLYAAPGETITVVIPAGAAKQKLNVRVGAHRDTLWHLDAWKRFPEITRAWPLTAITTQVANPFGGLIYVEVPHGCALGRLPVILSGVVAAPFYVPGQTSVEDWKAKLRHCPGPWGELASSKVILTLPSEVLRTLDDPQALMETWDRVLDLEAELATIPKQRARPERIVCDVQISAGYMHAGYPIMTWMDQPKNFASREALLNGNWGIFHELGHNHQVRDWTFEGTTEVTCNLFSLYVFDRLCGVKPSEYAHGRSKTRIIDLYAKYRAGGEPSFDRWKKDPFVALCMYAQLQNAFGWEAYQKVFAEYQSLPPNQRPKSDQVRRDQWLVRFSRAAGHNLAPFFKKWGVPVTDGAAASVAGLPAWLPPGME